MQSKKQRQGKGMDSPESLITVSKVTSLTLVAMVLVLAWGRVSHNDAADTGEGRSLQVAASQEIERQTQELRALAEAAPRSGAMAAIDCRQ